jgi:hypothetical protein
MYVGIIIQSCNKSLILTNSKFSSIIVTSSKQLTPFIFLSYYRNFGMFVMSKKYNSIAPVEVEV